MPPILKVQQLPPEVKEWLDKALIENNFSDYEYFAKELNKRGHQTSKSGVYRYGKKFQRKLEDIQASTAAAMAIATSEDAKMRNAAAINLVQAEMFDVLVSLQDVKQDNDSTDRVKLLREITKSLSDLSRTNINQEKWLVHTDARIKANAAENEKQSQGRGITPETIRKMRKVLGIEYDNGDG